MMRKIMFLLLFVLASSVQSLFATYSSELYRAVQLQGAYGDVVSIDFDEIASQSQTYLIGMPFNILDQSVQYTDGPGRIIARWSILTNTNFDIRLSIDADKLHHETQSSTPLDFILRFTYNLSYYIGGKPADPLSGNFEFDTSNNEETETVIPQNTIPDTGSFIGSVEGLVYFKFKDGQEPIINAAPAGNYIADVKIQVVVK